MIAPNRTTPAPSARLHVPYDRRPFGASLVATAAEWASRFTPDLPGHDDHRRSGESCARCGGLWPCQSITDTEETT